MTIAEYLKIKTEYPSSNDTLAADIHEYNTYDLEKLQVIMAGTEELRLLCNQLIWNHLLQAKVLTPSCWGQHTLKENVCCTDVHDSKHCMLYIYHTLPAEPLNIISSGYDFPEYAGEIRMILDYCYNRISAVGDVINAGVGTEGALWFMDELHKIKWYYEEVWK